MHRLTMPLMILTLATTPAALPAGMGPAPIRPYEAAWIDAAIVVQGDVVAYEPADGACMLVRQVLRGPVEAGERLRLDGSAGFSFLADRPAGVTVFASARASDTLTLWQPPTTGGLIWMEPEALAQIARAHADPAASLAATAPRERLAAAYFLATTAGDPALSGVAIESIAWGLEQPSHATNQAAVDTLAATGHTLDSLGITYHPAFKPELKQAAAARLLQWWSEQR